MPSSRKTTALTQEVVRVKRNMRPGQPEEVTTRHLNDISARMQASGPKLQTPGDLIRDGRF